MTTEPKTERERYIEKLQGDISKAVTAKRFNESEEGKLIREFLVERINVGIKEIGGTKYLNDQQGYAMALGDLHANQRLLAMLDSQASKDTTEMSENLRTAKIDG